MSERSERALRKKESTRVREYEPLLNSITFVLLTRSPPAPLKMRLASLGADWVQCDKCFKWRMIKPGTDLVENGIVEGGESSWDCSKNTKVSERSERAL